jgi:hypothetical protein
MRYSEPQPRLGFFVAKQKKPGPPPRDEGRSPQMVGPKGCFRVLKWLEDVLATVPGGQEAP